MTTIDDRSLVTRAEYAEFIELDADRAILLDPKAGSYFEFNATGGAVWRILERPSKIADIVEQLSSEFGGVVENEVTVFIEQLASRGLVAIPA
ncbi:MULTISPECIES: PqqD family protein [Mycobacteriaceae]|jgi:hypothetical protein|uniref:Coenzyme PQQ synthesis protein D (PqqD) n=1 Tax=Mycolicibacterium fluoranthenivorans TaxID=258505 RepID=A0A1G4VS97_9MYCO|nr:MULTISPECIES: PqqD family protein [Mycobacteriaceae]MCV7251784.1 PqqD family protein [Mycobacterium hackensackense]SCX11157.1 Coenzyme PQQ synthesis protein D (PqqD) [Mycolicibacterium fluoranthenivorans]